MRPSSRSRGYTAQWDREALRYRRQHPLCAMCLKRGIKSLAECVDHIVPHQGNKGLFWSRANWQSLCTPCHSSKKQSEERRGYSEERDSEGYPKDPHHPANDHLAAKKWPYSIPQGTRHSAIPVTLIAGPPGSGKSTYAKAHAQPGDTIVDFDECMKELGYSKWSQDPQHRKAAFRLRDAKIKGLATTTQGQAWVIVTAPTQEERRTWNRALGKAQWVVLDVPPHECKARIALDPARQANLANMNKVIDQWWADYRPTIGIKSDHAEQTNTEQNINNTRT